MLIFNRGRDKQGKAYFIPSGNMVCCNAFQPNSFISFRLGSS